MSSKSRVARSPEDYRGLPAGVGVLTGMPRWLLVVVWAGVVAATVSASPGPLPRQIATGAVMAISALALLTVRRQRRRVRMAALTIAAATGIAGIVLAPNGVAEVPVFLTAALLPLAFSGRALWIFVVVHAIATDVAIVWISGSYLGLLAGLGIPLLAQRTVAQQQLITERDRAQALLAEVQASRDAETSAAALRERGRIAREMHDVLAHSLAGLSLQLQAARAIAGREGASAVLEPLDKAAELARDGLSEARSAVSALRDPGGLGLAELPDLVERVPGDARLRSTGTPGTLTQDAGHALYRSIQEALTNAARYAPGSPVRVELAWASSRLTATVEDDGPRAGHDVVAGQGSGLGLSGMDERVRAVGGTVRAGPRGERGWQVQIEIPTEEQS